MGRWEDKTGEDYLCKDCSYFRDLENEGIRGTPNCVDPFSKKTEFIYGKTVYKRKNSVAIIRAGKGKWPCTFKSRYNK